MRIGRDAKTDLLKRVPLFSGCTKSELEALALTADELDVREGTVLTREGKPGREFFVLIEGTVQVTRDGTTIAELGPGDWLGEIALLTQSPRTATAIATSSARILVVTDRAFRQVVEKTPSIALKVLETLGERLGHDAELERG